jgi:hypothetical protein
VTFLLVLFFGAGSGRGIVSAYKDRKKEIEREEYCNTINESKSSKTSTIHQKSEQHSTAQHSTAQHSTAQHSTAQHSTAQKSTIEGLRESRLPTTRKVLPIRRNQRALRRKQVTRKKKILN